MMPMESKSVDGISGKLVMKDNTHSLPSMLVNYESWIGKKCQKKRGGRNPKPFKSTFRVNTIKELTVNPYTLKPAFSFLEDDSIVNCETVELVEH